MDDTNHAISSRLASISVVSLAMFIICLVNIEDYESDDQILMQDWEAMSLGFMCISSITAFIILFTKTCKNTISSRYYQIGQNNASTLPDPTMTTKINVVVIFLCLMWLIACMINLFYIDMYEKIIKQNLFKIRHWSVDEKFSDPIKNHWGLTHIISQLFYYSFVILYFIFYVLFPLFGTTFTRTCHILTILFLSCVFLNIWTCTWGDSYLSEKNTRNIANIQFGNEMIMVNICVYCILSFAHRSRQNDITIDKLDSDGSNCNIATGIPDVTSTKTSKNTRQYLLYLQVPQSVSSETSIGCNNDESTYNSTSTKSANVTTAKTQETSTTEITKTTQNATTRDLIMNGANNINKIVTIDATPTLVTTNTSIKTTYVHNTETYTASSDTSSSSKAKTVTTLNTASTNLPPHIEASTVGTDEKLLLGSDVEQKEITENSTNTSTNLNDHPNTRNINTDISVHTTHSDEHVSGALSPQLLQTLAEEPKTNSLTNAQANTVVINNNDKLTSNTQLTQFEKWKNNSSLSVSLSGIKCLQALNICLIWFSLFYFEFNYFVTIYQHSIIHSVYSVDQLPWLIGYFWEYYAKIIIILLFILIVVTLEVIYPSIKHFKTKYKLTWKSMFFLFAKLFDYRNERIILYVYSYFIFAVPTYITIVYWCLFTWTKDHLSVVVTNNDNNARVYVVLGLSFLFIAAPLLFLINVCFVQLGIKMNIKRIHCKWAWIVITKKRLNHCTGIGIIYCLILATITCSIFANNIDGDSTAMKIWPVVVLIFIWDFWYNACDIINWQDINANGLNIKAIRVYVAGFVLGILIMIFLVGFIILAILGPDKVRFGIKEVNYARDVVDFIYNVSTVLTWFSCALLIPFLSLLYVKYNFIPHESEKCWYLFYQLTNLLCFDLFDKICPRCHDNYNCCNWCKRNCECHQRSAQYCCDKIVDPCCCDACFGLIKKIFLHRCCCLSCFGVVHDDTLQLSHAQPSFNPKCQQIFINIIGIWLLFVGTICFLQKKDACYLLFRIFMIVCDILTESN